MGGLQGWHLIIVLLVILLLFGAAKLPALAKSVGQSARVFKGEMKAMKDEDAPRDAGETEAAPTRTSEPLTPPQSPPSSAGGHQGTPS